MGLADGNFGLMGGLGNGGMSQDQANRRNQQLAAAQLGSSSYFDLVERYYDRKIEAAPKTIRQKLQAETNEWLKDVFK
jgi:hypothetical protein